MRLRRQNDYGAGKCSLHIKQQSHRVHGTNSRGFPMLGRRNFVFRRNHLTDRRPSGWVNKAADPLGREGCPSRPRAEYRSNGQARTSGGALRVHGAQGQRALPHNLPTPGRSEALRPGARPSKKSSHDPFFKTYPLSLCIFVTFCGQPESRSSCLPSRSLRRRLVIRSKNSRTVFVLFMHFRGHHNSVHPAIRSKRYLYPSLA
jgi:hypothetical protein